MVGGKMAFHLGCGILLHSAGLYTKNTIIWCFEVHPFYTPCLSKEATTKGVTRYWNGLAFVQTVSIAMNIFDVVYDIFSQTSTHRWMKQVTASAFFRHNNPPSPWKNNSRGPNQLSQFIQ